jgi:hypothetical protein
MLLDGEGIPLATDIERHRDHPDFADGIWTYVLVDISKLRASQWDLSTASN